MKLAVVVVRVADGEEAGGRHQSLDLVLIGIDQKAHHRFLIVRLIGNIGEDEDALLREARSENQNPKQGREGVLAGRLHGGRDWESIPAEMGSPGKDRRGRLRSRYWSKLLDDMRLPGGGGTRKPDNRND